MNELNLKNGSPTKVMSLIGISDYNYKKKVYALIDKLNTEASPPDIITDLSILSVNKKDTLWYYIINETNSLSATLPCYYLKNRGNICSNELLDIAHEQIEEGVKLITIHPTPNKDLFELSKKRLVPITSRGGGIILHDLIQANFVTDNAYMKILPNLIKLAKKKNTIISIGASFRAANIFDSLDAAQLKEIKLQLEIAEFIKSYGVEVIIETPGHISPEKITHLAKLFKNYNFPLMPLGPIVTETGAGMDHIVAAIGAVIMGFKSNIKLIAAVTAEEHTGRVPQDKSILYALKTAKLAAHIIDMYKIKDYAMDNTIALGRSRNKTCIYGSKEKGCSRCGPLCPLINNLGERR